MPALHEQGVGSFVEVYRGSERNLCFYTTLAFSRAGCKVEPLIPKTLWQWMNETSSEVSRLFLQMEALTHFPLILL